MPEALDDSGMVTATFCATLVDEWVRAGVTHAVIAPGSRSTPVALALTARPEITVHVHHDERSAAFMALGLGRELGFPAVVLTTSGTAAVELHPAVVEAHLSAVPMLVVTADRPPELHDVGAPQTVDQTHLYGSSVRWFAEPGPPVHETVDTWRSLASRAVVETVDHPAGAGPVHLNLGFRDPLVGEAAEPPPGRSDGRPWHQLGGRRSVLDRAGSVRLAGLLDRPRGVIVAGAGAGDPATILELAEAANWPILADPRSGCRLDHPAVVSHADTFLRDGDVAAELRPEVVLRTGEPAASKILSTWLAESEAEQIVLAPDARWFDHERTASIVMRVDPTAAVHALAHMVSKPRRDDWIARWEDLEASATAAVSEVLDDRAEATEPGVARTLCSTLGADDTLVVSSSMPVRDIEWFGGRTRAVVRSNRGANGIDGVMSTAVGAALAARGSRRRTTVLVGDVAFLHDTNALLGLANRDVDLQIVVIDNDGGGIFSFLPQAELLEATRFEQLFGTPHGVDLAMLCAAHDIDCVDVTDARTLADLLRDGRAGGTRVIRIRTDRDANVRVHDELVEAVSLRGG